MVQGFLNSKNMKILLFIYLYVWALLLAIFYGFIEMFKCWARFLHPLNVYRAYLMTIEKIANNSDKFQL